MSRGHPLLLSTKTPEHLNQDRENVDKAAQTRPVRTQGTLYFANGMNYFWRMSFRSSWLGGGGGAAPGYSAGTLQGFCSMQSHRDRQPGPAAPEARRGDGSRLRAQGKGNWGSCARQQAFVPDNICADNRRCKVGSKFNSHSIQIPGGGEYLLIGHDGEGHDGRRRGNYTKSV